MALAARELEVDVESLVGALSELSECVDMGTLRPTWYPHGLVEVNAEARLTDGEFLGCDC